MKLEFVDVHFKNFLSYGNTWHTITFKEGINFIVGDIDKNIRTNTVGKSSALKSLMFAHFGSLSDVVKNDIINWQNRKKCEVVHNFKKGDDLITIKRGIKPNFFEIYKNGNPQPQESDVRVVQRKYEEETLEWTSDMFMNLIHCNPNNTISILNTSADKKRKFIENLFSDIKYFSAMTQKVNKKIEGIKEKQRDINFKLSHFEESRYEIHNEINKLNEELENINVVKSLKEYNKQVKEHEALIDKDISIDVEKEKSELEKVEKEISEKDRERANINQNIYKINADITTLTNEYDKSLESKKYTDELEEVKNKIEDTEELEKEIANLVEKSDKLNDNKEDLKKKRYEKLGDITSLKKQKKSLSPDENLKNNVNCYTCGSEINYEEVKAHFDKERKKCEQSISNINTELESLDEKIDKLDAENLNTINTLQSKRDKLSTINKAKEKREYLESFIESFRSLEDIQKDIDDKQKELEGYKTKLNDVDSKITHLLVAKDDVKYNVDIVNARIKELNDKKARLNEAKLKYDYDKKAKIDIEKRIKDKKDKIDNIESQKNQYSDSHTKLNNLMDYFTYLKDSLKDNNIKADIIKGVIPLLNQKTNEYLSVIGFDFYVLFDDWLNITIHGPGNRQGCKLGSLSGGESKSVDIATRLALMEIAQQRSRIFPDILILDEILDSSIDTFGISKLMEIIRYKQQRDNLKVYIISHRQEINEFTGDSNIIKIYKDNNFSHLQEA